LATSFFMSITYPTIFAVGVRTRTPNSKLGGSLIVMALVGGATMPPVLGYVARETGSYATGYLAPLAGFVVVMLCAFFGSGTNQSETP
jgi:MFS transporter, FHS family, L-fucose permease